MSTERTTSHTKAPGAPQLSPLGEDIIAIIQASSATSERINQLENRLSRAEANTRAQLLFVAFVAGVGTMTVIALIAFSIATLFVGG